MRRLKDLKAELTYLDDFLTMIEAYEEISASRMRKVKKSVLKRREFMQGLNEAFAYIAYSYKVFKKNVKRGVKADILNTNGKTALVLLSSNTGLYGDIIRKIFDMFMAEATEKKDADLIIAGRRGKSLYDSSGSKRPYKFFEISDTGVDEVALKSVVNYVSSYSEVVVYHGVFKSILSQEPKSTHVTGEVLKVTEGADEYNVPFLFEPNIKNVAEYFEKQILSLIFEQALFESSLSKFASRMVSLDSAAANINQKISHVDFEIKKAKHRAINLGIQGTMAGGDLWK
ncbi:MAG: hypothetical protein KatS3mg087_1492 [Patescibacteria group bacterium]|nr:MAG: hypothetical protein KatS3mg087_1492 [Patescibacteria group bacterium]